MKLILIVKDIKWLFVIHALTNFQDIILNFVQLSLCLWPN